MPSVDRVPADRRDQRWSTFRRVSPPFRPAGSDDTHVVVDTNVTEAEPKVDEPEEHRGAPADPVAADQPAESEPPAAPPAQKRSWSMPKSPVTREHVDGVSRAAFKVVTAIAKFVADVARFGARAVAKAWRAVGAVPPALRLFTGAGLLMLSGIVGAITLDNTVGLVCIVVVVPVCSATLGVLGYRWYSGLSGEAVQRTGTQPEQPESSELQRSVQYVDRKLALALTSLGTEHHQQAVIALFQAKTAVELTLGTERDDAGDVAVPLRPADPRPRIRAGTTSALRESNSLAAS